MSTLFEAHCNALALRIRASQSWGCMVLRKGYRSKGGICLCRGVSWSVTNNLLEIKCQLMEPDAASDLQ